MYEKTKLQEKRSWFFQDELFVWGIVLAPMTALRVWKLGPGEILLSLWMLATFFGSNPSTKYQSGTLAFSMIGKYQLFNISMMTFGLIVNVILYHVTVSIGPNVTSLLTHFFVFLVSSCMVIYFEERPIVEINNVIRKIVIRGAIIYSALLLYAMFFGTSLFGVKLWLGSRGYRFLGLALNPHQIGMITGPGLIFSFYLIGTIREWWKKSLYILLAGIWFWISLSLRSDTLTISYVILVAMVLGLKLLKSTDDPELRHRNNIVIIITIGIVFVVLLPRLWNRLVDFISGAGNGLGRIELWQAGLGQFRDKPVCLFTGLGYDAGTGLFMKSGNEIEAHNTYVQQILSGGIFVFISYSLMLFQLIKKPTEKNTWLVCLVMYFFLYGFGGNMNRRVLVWFTYTMVMILTEKTRNTEIADK